MWDRADKTAEQLRAALAAKDQFLRFIFHEMRVPLNAVSLAVEELGERAVPAADPATQGLLDIAITQVGPGP